MSRVLRALKWLRLIAEIIVSMAMLGIAALIMLFGMFLQQWDAAMVGFLLACVFSGLLYTVYRSGPLS